MTQVCLCIMTRSDGLRARVTFRDCHIVSRYCKEKPSRSHWPQNASGKLTPPERVGDYQDQCKNAANPAILHIFPLDQQEIINAAAKLWQGPVKSSRKFKYLERFITLRHNRRGAWQMRGNVWPHRSAPQKRCAVCGSQRNSPVRPRLRISFFDELLSVKKSRHNSPQTYQNAASFR